MSPEQIHWVLQAYSEGNSLRGISRTNGLAYNTVVSMVSIVRSASQEAKLVHNKAVQSVETAEVCADEISEISSGLLLPSPA